MCLHSSINWYWDPTVQNIKLDSEPKPHEILRMLILKTQKVQDFRKNKNLPF